MQTEPEVRPLDPERTPAPQTPISVVVPVLDERPNLERLARAITASLDGAGLDFEVIFVDDGSTDGSSALLDELHGRDERLKVIHFVRNYGQTAALSAGFRAARHEVVVTLDADLQNDPADIPPMVAMLDDDLDLVCGWRRDRQDSLLDRRIPSRVANRLIARMTRVVLHDYGCTLRVYRRRLLDSIPLYGQMHRFIPVYLAWAGARMVQVPVRHHPRTDGRSKYGLGRTFPVLLDLMTMRLLRDYYVNPVYSFGYLGFACLAGGVLSGLAAVILGLLTAAGPFGTALLLLAVMLVLLGFNAFFFGLMSEVLMRMRFEMRRRDPFRVRSTRGDLPSFDDPR